MTDQTTAPIDESGAVPTKRATVDANGVLTGFNYGGEGIDVPADFHGVPGTLALVDGEWQPYEPPMSEAQVRAERQRLLNMSDWTQLRDVPEATAAAWAKYRQALRDVTSQADFPVKVKWPKAPT